MAKQIDPKPTTYRGIHYESRLEARWAVLFDNSPNILHFKYHPETWTLRQKGWTYTPDFQITYCLDHLPKPSHLYIEIKPKFPTEEYLDFLMAITAAKGKPLYLICGPIYGNEIELESILLLGDKHEPAPLLKYFPHYVGSYLIASKYRFDI